MPRTLSAVLTALFLFLACGCAQAQTPGAEYPAAPCKVAPRIDGVESPGEWAAAAPAETVLAMRSGKGQARPDRRAELRFMSSASNLYVSMRLPDAARDMTTSPLVADLVVLAFCRGSELSAGDDRRAMLPGVFADKHWVSPGKDADDPHRDGQGAMEWRKTASGGEYFMEWQVPLKSGDKNDVATVPGERLRFNILYIDRFSPTLEGTELGGVFGADTDHSGAWGSVRLAAQVGAEKPAPAPEWIARLFPHTGPPARVAPRLRRVDAGEIQVGVQTVGSVILELKYPGLDGKDALGQARLFLPPGVRTDPKRRVPLVHIAGYEANEGAAAGLLAQGYAVSTPHGHPLNPLGRGVHLDQAILHAVRALPCIDPLRVGIQGGSAGGWMTLMLTADAFPLMWSMPDVPPIHFGYNAAYIGENQKHTTAAPGSTQLRLPVLAAVGGIVEQAHALYGVAHDSGAYLAVSPLAHLDAVTAPTLAVFSTADMLVPIDQVSPKLVQPWDAKLFPSGFSMALTERFPGLGAKRTLLEALPAQRYQLFQLPSGDNPTRLGVGVPQGPVMPRSLPFSRERVWSIVVVDEGPPEPTVGHFKYHWALDHEPFRKWAESRGVTADQLTAPKLRRLMKRYRGEAAHPLRVRPGNRGEEIDGNVLDYPEAERADVLLGLAAFAQVDARALRLAQLYAALPPELKALGPRLGSGAPAGVRAALAAVGK